MKLNEHQLKLFKDLTLLNGVSGFEDEVRQYLKNTYLALGFELMHDNLGSLVAYKKSQNKDAKKVLVLGHMDEVGFLVSNILSNGLIKANPVGGMNLDTLPSSRVVLKTSENKYFKGAINAVAPHLLKNNQKLDSSNLLFDFGFKSKDDALSKGVQIGQMMTFEGSFELLNDERILTKAVDDRYGLVLGIELLEAIKDKELDYDLYVGGSVQEEVGCRGAQTICNLINPDFVIVLDCSPARDFEPSSQELGKLGEGLLIRYMDGSMIAFKELLDFQIACCTENNIKYQYYDSPGGTDAGIIHKSGKGVLTLTHCLCARGIHSPATIFDVNDYLACKEALLIMINKLSSSYIKDLSEVRK